MEQTGDVVRLEWTPRPAEYADAHLARMRTMPGALRRPLVAVLLALVGVLLLPHRDWASVGVALLAVAFVLAFGSLSTRLLRGRYAGQFAGNPALGDPMVMTLDDAGVHVTTQRLDSTRTWAAFASWLETPEAVVLATSPGRNASIVVLPHRALGDPDGPDGLDALRELLGRHLGPPASTPGGGAARR